MTTLGLIGGMSWHSTIEYYRVINETVARRLGGHHSAPVLIDSLDFQTVRDLQLAEDWEGAGRHLADSARRLERAGADVVMIATNLMHKVAPAVEAATDASLLHIGDAVGARAAREGLQTVGLLGTRWVMAETFYPERLARHGVATVSPDPSRHAEIDRIIFDELTRGIVREESRAYYRSAVDELVARGAQAIVLACTEIMLLLGDDDASVPLVDSMTTHALAAAEVLLADGPGPAPSL
ncbi:aspartate/glutamate racemase family protein [Aestuariimicrobium soli]|uniref:aspartate/glutamate racemase family protein n=1 Tax=Aestuariimicrobium soli TaxID=2035834 RepID=UPI003EBE1E3C